MQRPSASPSLCGCHTSSLPPHLCQLRAFLAFSHQGLGSRPEFLGLRVSGFGVRCAQFRALGFRRADLCRRQSRPWHQTAPKTAQITDQPTDQPDKNAVKWHHQLSAFACPQTTFDIYNRPAAFARE
eukprot:2590216-Rhodomonas_salina.1